MSLTREEVEHIGRLARLGLTDEEVARFQEQLSEILNHFDALPELDTKAFPPIPYPRSLQNGRRAARAQGSAPTCDVLANAPRAEDGAFRVRVVLDD